MAKILILTSRWPWPPHGGDRIRILEICRELSREHQLTLVACSESVDLFHSEEEFDLFERVEVVRIPKWRSLLNCLIAVFTREPLQLAYYRSRRYAEVVAPLEKESDVVIAHLIRTAQYVSGGSSCLRILEITDAVSLVLDRAKRRGRRGRIGNMLRLIYSLEADRVRSYEASCLKKFDCVSVVSEVDRLYLADGVPSLASKLIVATNGVARRDRLVLADSPCEILFIGNMGTLPNIDACEYFIRECLPMLRAKLPEVRFRIIGPITQSVAYKLAHDNPAVRISGEVQDFRECASGAFCGVAPMRLGAGIQNKILDYMSFGLPCVTTSLGYEGLSARIGQQLIVADTPGAIVDSILSLYNDREFRSNVGEEGREYVRQCHSWGSCLTPLMDVIESRVVG